MKFTKNDLLYAGLTKDEYETIKNDVSEENRNNLKMCAAIVAFFFALMFICSLFFDIAKAGRWIYFSLLCVDLALYVLYKCVKMSRTALIFNVYIFWSVLFAVGILLATVVAPDKNAVTFIALLLVAPLLFSDKPIRVICFLLIYTIIFIIAALFLKDPSVRTMDVIHVILFCTVSVIVGFFAIRTKYQRYYFDYRSRYLSLTDLLTGVNNRNSFELNKGGHIESCKRGIGCCYVDANGLHECNNELGHNNGDEMLKNIARELTRLFGSENVYRVGGDEFVAFLADADKNETEQKLNELKSFSAAHGNLLSFGYAEQDKIERDTEQLIKAAESEMYLNKKRYYAEQNEQEGRYRGES